MVPCGGSSTLMKENPYFSLIGGRFARACSLSGISMGLIEWLSPGHAWWVRDKVMAGGTPANPATLVG